MPFAVHFDLSLLCMTLTVLLIVGLPFAACDLLFTNVSDTVVLRSGNVISVASSNLSN